MEGNEKGETTISIFDSIGKKVKETYVMLEGFPSQADIDISYLPKGIYVLMLKTKNQTWEEKLMIK